jgi:hypothetical protein
MVYGTLSEATVKGHNYRLAQTDYCYAKKEVAYPVVLPFALTWVVMPITSFAQHTCTKYNNYMTTVRAWPTFNNL